MVTAAVAGRRKMWQVMDWLIGSKWHGSLSPTFFFKFIYLLIFYFWLCWVFVSVQGLSLVAASGGHSSSRCAGLSPSRPLPLRSTGSRRAGSVVVAHGPSCSVACGILPDQVSNPRPLHWQADPEPLRHQGSPSPTFLWLPKLKRGLTEGKEVQFHHISRRGRMRARVSALVITAVLLTFCFSLNSHKTCNGN